MGKSRIALQVFIVLAIYHVLTFYIGWNITIWIKTTFTFHQPLLSIFIFAILSYSFLLARYLHFYGIFKIIGSLWIGFFQYAVLLFPFANLIVLLFTFTTIPIEIVITSAGYITFIMFLCIFGIGLYNAYQPIIRNYSLTIKKNKGQLTSLKIAMASDMHFGTLSGLRHAKRLVKEVNEMKPDLILLPGDIIDDDLKVFLRKNMSDVLAKFNAPLGVYGVLGNHEYYGGDKEKFVEEMRKIGITILEDEIIPIQDKFIIIGRKDKTDKQRKTITELVTNTKTYHLPTILMDHQPYDLNEAMINGIDISLSGHTHRGQMVPNHIITRRIFEIDWGYKKKDQLHAIVSSGYGFWGPPLRLGSRSEIIEIDITFTD
ncbi:metallophosphoesterase [Alkalihalobacterium bogoriense]|uniref:metallophosphoesterase n=1 Tax=Alkalihalobacterium bogoriense TaxID=246272 RepID=UPI0005581D31|nr:metallophosphoesterase [Alkalihalobacterium bogoriense]